MKVGDIAAVLERLAPPALAAEWDNVGLLIGDKAAAAGKLMLCIDLTAAVLAEALAAKARMVMAYHPPIFKPLSRLTADCALVVLEAVRRGVAVYSMHTALDACPGGTNDVLAAAIGLEDVRPLEASVGGGQCKIVVFVPEADLARVSQAAFDAGAGRIGNYSGCSFFTGGVGTFFGGAGARPAVGQAGLSEQVQELRLEVIAPRTLAAAVVQAVRASHSYETPAIDVYPLEDLPAGCGQGRVGRLARPTSAAALIARAKRACGVRGAFFAAATGAAKQRIATAAVLAGAGRGYWRQAMQAGATFYLTGEMPHHDALAAAQAGLSVLCLGHSNSERIALAALARNVIRLAPGLKILISRRDADPYTMV